MKVVDEKAILEFLKRGESILFLKGARLTPAAKDLIRAKELRILSESGDYIPVIHPPRRIVIGSDHGGFELKQSLLAKLESSGYTVQDVGTQSSESVDYPDFALKVAEAVAQGKADRGVMIDTIGIASAMAANKVRGVRAAPCWNVETAISARGHNDANLITLGGKVVDADHGWAIVRAFLEEPFQGGRHEKRVRKIEAMGRF